MDSFRVYRGGRGLTESNAAVVREANPNAVDRPSRNPGQAFSVILDTVRLVLGVPHAAVILAPTAPTASLAEAFASCVMDKGEPAAAGEVGLGDHGGPDAPRAIAAAPFTTKRGQSGAVVVTDTHPRVFGPRELEIVARFAQLVSIDIELQERAGTDDLTGLARRQPFMGELENLFAVHRDSGAQSVLAIMDLDHFKRINDSFGHAAGDRILRLVAETMRSCLGPEALLCRLGGEEFAIALPDTTLSQALPDLERLRRSISALGSDGPTAMLVSASFGIAPVTPVVSTVSAWFKIADSALYGAKQAGRNQIRVGWQSGSGGMNITPRLASDNQSHRDGPKAIAV